MYRIINTHGIPQCGCEVIEVETWDEISEYFDDEFNLEMLEDGYAWVDEV